MLWKVYWRICWASHRFAWNVVQLGSLLYVAMVFIVGVFRCLFVRVCDPRLYQPWCGSFMISIQSKHNMNASDFGTNSWQKKRLGNIRLFKGLNVQRWESTVCRGRLTGFPPRFTAYIEWISPNAVGLPEQRRLSKEELISGSVSNLMWKLIQKRCPQQEFLKINELLYL